MKKIFFIPVFRKNVFLLWRKNLVLAVLRMGTFQFGTVSLFVGKEV